VKALTLTQPWATLMAVGAKRYETRSWSTSYQGPLAIHAGKGLGPVGGLRGLRALCALEPFRSVLTEAGYADPRDLPRGRVVAEGELVGCFSTLAVGDELSALAEFSDVSPADHEEDFGDYGPGRFAWAIADVGQQVSSPVSGSLGLWDAPCLSRNPHQDVLCELDAGHDGLHVANGRTWNWGDS
jgi:hypothetical protein